MMNAGLSALMPGQAAPNMAGVLPQPSQAAPDAVPSKVDALARLPFEQLQAMYRNPPKGVPAYAIIAARDKQIKAEQMRQAQQGLMAQQQVAGQRGTVADNVMAVRAASGGEMRVQAKIQQQPVPGMASGGMVAFDKGGLAGADFEGLDEDIVADEFSGFNTTPEQMVADELRVGNAAETRRRAEIRQQYKFLKEASPPQAQQLLAREPWLEPNQPATAARPAGPAAAAATPLADRGLGATRQPPPAQTPPPAPTQQRQQSQVPAFDINTLTRALEQTGVIPPEILEERKALAAARKAQLERQQAAAQRYKAGLEESPEDRRMRAFAAIAKGLSSSPRLSKGLSAALSELVGSETEARRARREGMKEVMTLEDAAANLQIAMQEQALADRTGDNKLKTAAAVAVAQAQQAYQKALFDQGIAAREVAAKEVAASNTGISRSSSTENTMLRERADALSKRIETLAKKADPLSPYSQAEKAAAQKQMEVLQAQLDRLLGLAPAAPTAASGSRIREVLVINPATGLLVPKPQP